MADSGPLMCRVCNRKPGRLGKKPNKYCYAVNCYNEGVRLGHITPSSSARAAKAAVGSQGPASMQMERDEEPLLAPALPSGLQITELFEFYGVRCAPPRQSPSCTLSAPFHPRTGSLTRGR